MAGLREGSLENGGGVLHRNRSEEARLGFIRPLGKANVSVVGLVGDLDKLARAGLPIPEGFVPTG